MKSRALSLVLVLAVAPAVAARADVDQPQAILDRPRTLPRGELGVVGTLAMQQVDVVMPGAMATGAVRSDTFMLAAGYGVTRDLDVHVMYPVEVRPSLDGDSRVVADVGFTFLRGALSAAAHVQGGYESGTPPLAPLQLGVDVQYNLSSHVALFTGDHQLAFGLTGDNRPITIELPVGVAVQLGPAVHLSLQTSLARFGLYESATRYAVRDRTPIDLRGFYSPSNRVDLFAQGLVTDLRRAGDGFAIAGGARLFF